MKSRPLSQPILILALFACAARADYINSTVSLGGYALDSKDATHNGDFYQMERINVSALKDGLELHVAYGYSDFYEKRPNTYQKSNRLALANVSYAPKGLDGFKVKVGRDFMTLIERPVYYDGGDAKYQYQGSVQAELFGGYGVPTVYQSDIADFNSDKTIIGGKLTLIPLPALLLHFDGLLNGKHDNGTLGGEVQGRVSDRVTLSANSVFRLDSNYFSHAEVSALTRIRKSDQFQIRYGIQEQKIDSTRNYDYFVNRSHQFLLSGYVFSWSNKISADLDCGLLMYQDTVGQMLDVKLNLYGFFAQWGQEFSTTTNALELKGGYSNTYWSRYRIDVAGGYTRYDLDVMKTNLNAFDFSVQPTLLLGRGFEVTMAYEYLHNRLYDRDQRYFVGIKQSFFRGLSK